MLEDETVRFRVIVKIYNEEKKRLDLYECDVVNGEGKVNYKAGLDGLLFTVELLDRVSANIRLSIENGEGLTDG